MVTTDSQSCDVNYYCDVDLCMITWPASDDDVTGRREGAWPMTSSRG